MKSLLMMAAAIIVAETLWLFFALDRLHIVKEKLADVKHLLQVKNTAARPAMTSTLTHKVQCHRCRCHTTTRETSPDAPSRQALLNARFNERLEARQTPEPSWIND